MKVYGFIFARGGSKGLPNKNIKHFFGIPLIARAIIDAKEAGIFERIIVSTDSEEIAEIAIRYGAEVPFMRPAKLATDYSAELDSWKHALDYLENNEGVLPEIMTSIPTTSPLRLPLDIIHGVERFRKGDVDLVVGITPSKKNPFFNIVTKSSDGFLEVSRKTHKKITRRQDAPETFDITTVVYVASTKFVMSASNLYDGRVAGVIIPAERCIDIDDEIDFELAKLLFKQRLNPFEENLK